MDLFDRVALWGRSFHMVTNPKSKNGEFALNDVLDLFSGYEIVKISPKYLGIPLSEICQHELNSDPLIDSIERINHIGPVTINNDSFNVTFTAPSGDYAKAVVYSFDSKGNP